MADALSNFDRSAPQTRRKPAYLFDWAKADFGKELQKPFWTIDDAVPILLSISPCLTSPEELARNRFADDVAYEADRLRRLVLDAQEMNDIGEKFRPHEFINWARKQHIAIPAELIKIAIARRLPIIDFIDATSAQLTASRKRCAELESALAVTSARNKEQDNTIAALKSELSGLVAAATRNAPNKPSATPSVQGSTPSTNAAVSRKYNKVAAMLTAIAKSRYGVAFGVPERPNLKKMIEDLADGGAPTDDETLQKHLLHGSDQLARSANSLK